jgi:dTDP-glucose pyrophosphorylase
MTKMVLSIGGSAERMLGLPKFLLPASNSESLIQRHLNGGFEAGIEEAILICRKDHEAILRHHLSNHEKKIRYLVLEHHTKTMCETLLMYVQSKFFSENESYILPLADTTFTGAEIRDIYTDLLTTRDKNALALFKIRSEQVGKLGQVEFHPVSKEITRVIDKDPSCPFPDLWGICLIQGELLADIRIDEAHIGISVSRWVSEGQVFIGLTNDAKYYDCGTFAEYRQFLLE